jgi:hypothetical protein
MSIRPIIVMIIMISIIICGRIVYIYIYAMDGPDIDRFISIDLDIYLYLPQKLYVSANNERHKGGGMDIQISFDFIITRKTILCHARV